MKKEDKKKQGKIKPITKEEWDKSLDWIKNAKLERIQAKEIKPIVAKKITRITDIGKIRLKKIK